jgi:hypothetical protein
MKNKQAKNVVKIIESANYPTPDYKIGCILLEFSHMSLYEEVFFHLTSDPKQTI